MYYTVLILSVLTASVSAEIHDDIDLIRAANARAYEISAAPLADIEAAENTIREPFIQQRQVAQKAIEDWQAFLKQQQTRFTAWMDEANVAAVACLQEKKDEMELQPTFSCLKMEVKLLEAKTETVRQDAFFAAVLESAENDKEQRFAVADQAYKARLAESDYNRTRGLSWCVNDGRYHQEHLANIYWERPSDAVADRFGLTTMNAALVTARQMYNDLVWKTFDDAHYYIGQRDEAMPVWQDEGNSYIAKLEAQIGRINLGESAALEETSQTRRQMLVGLQQEATRQVLHEVEMENEAIENEAMDNILAWLDELKG